MLRTPCFVLAGCLSIVSAGTGRIQAVGQGSVHVAASSNSPSSERALLNRYCVTCHSQKLKTGGLMLDTLDLADVSRDAEVWEKVVKKMRAGLMPPAGMPRPDRQSYDAFVTWLETAIDRSAASRPNPGRSQPFHRLNRSEYQNAIRDLLALEVDATALLPTDDSSYGFDNMAGVLRLSPTLMERYLSAAQKISRLAVGTPPLFVNVDTVTVRQDLSQDDRVDGLPFGTRGGVAVRHTFPLDAEYLIQVRLSRRGSSGGEEVDIPRFAETHDLEVSLDGERLQVFTLTGEPPAREGERTTYQAGDRANLDANWQLRLPVKAGPREVTVAFLKKSSAAVEAVRLPFLRPYAGAGGETRYQPYLSSVTITGPFAASGPGESPSRRRIFVCHPANESEESACARTILTTLARRAYRRPVVDTDIGTLLQFYQKGRVEAGTFEAGIQTAIERLLVSPQFLFRIEHDPAGPPSGKVYRVSDVELASRLSFFLWSSIPDDELLAAAEQGTLTDPSVLGTQVRRMLADRRSQALVDNFAGQWLYLRNLPIVAPDLDVFPDFDEGLRQAFKRETELFFESILREDRSVLELLTANYTFLNERLARHYGIRDVKGSHFRRVTLDDDARRGLLGKGSVLAVTAYPHRNSPVLRGKWVLENLLGTPPPAPPPNVPDLKDTNNAGKVLSMRERMVQHRSNAVCASCHSMMDPPGLALENFDALGRWRNVDEMFNPIDASGVLPDGTKFDGVAGLRQALLDRSETVVTTVIEKLLTYALGRGLEYYDGPSVRAIRREAARDNYQFSSLIVGIVNSIPFQMRGSQP